MKHPNPEHPLNQERSCIGKMQFPTSADAKRHLAYQAKRQRSTKRDAGRDLMNSYHCEYCGQYHVGHKPFARNRGPK